MRFWSTSDRPHSAKSRQLDKATVITNIDSAHSFMTLF